MQYFLFLLWNLSILLESLPISSSGHLRLVCDSIKQFTRFTPPKISRSAEHLMHIPNGIVITVFLMREALLKAPTLTAQLFHFLLSVALACTLTGCAYLLFKKKGTPRLPLDCGFFISGCLLLSLYWAPEPSQSSVSLFHAIIIGSIQAISLLPGISRMASTVVCSTWLGIDPQIGFLFSLTCECALIGVAVIIAFATEPSPTFTKKITRSQALLAIISTLTCYFLLLFSYTGFIQGWIVSTGWYLIGLSILTAFFYRTLRTSQS